MPFDRVHLEIGDTMLPKATVEGGSAGLASHGSAILLAGRRFRAEHGTDRRTAWGHREATTSRPASRSTRLHSYGAQFVEARVNVDTGEVRVPRLLGVFSCGRIVVPRTARSQLIGGMVRGLSMALHEKSSSTTRSATSSPTTSRTTTSPSHADIGDIDVSWLDEEDPHANPLGAKGIGEIGITGTAAAVANAVYNATGTRSRPSDHPGPPATLTAGRRAVERGRGDVGRSR